MRATDQHDAWSGSRYGDLRQEHSAPFVQTPEQPRSSLLRPRVGFHPPCQEVEFDTPAFSGLDRENSQSVRPRFSADNDPNYLSQGPSSSCSDVEKLVGALYTLTNRVNQRPLALSKEELFDGNPLNYRRFIRHFDAYIARGVVDMADRLNLLISSCTGEAKESIADCILARSPDLGYDEARRILEVNFGQEHAIVSAYVRKLTEGPPIRSNDKSALAQLARDMRNCEISCGGMSSAGLNTQHTVASIFKRLPANLQDKFMASVGPQLERGQPILFSQLSEFLERRSLIEKSFLGQLAYHRKERGFSSSSQPDFGPRRAQKYSVNTAQVGDDDSRGNVAKQGCAFCLGQHAIWRCERFSKQPLRKRRAIVKSENLCFNCLGSHLVRACKSKSTCRKCGGRHNTLLHEELQEVLPKENTPPLQERQDVNGAGLSSRVMSVVQNIGSKCNEHTAGPNTSSFAQTKDSTAVRLKVVPVRVWGAGRRRHADVYAFLDEGSDTSLCTEDLIKLLGLKGKPTQFSLSTMSGTEQQSGRQVSLCVQGLNEDAVVNLSNVLSVARLPDLGTSIPSCRDHEIHGEVLKGVTFPDLCGKVELLIGANVPEAHRTLEYRINHSGGPNAVKSPLGWSLIGPTQGAKTVNFVNFVQTNSFKVRTNVKENTPTRRGILSTVRQCSRVAPIKPVTIPRMELVAAVVGVELTTFLKRELDLKLDDTIFWTDSTSVLQYIKSSSKRFKTFVANRIAAIQAGSSPSQWRHVGTAHNPADIASRGISPSRLASCTSWLKGPDFLWKDEDAWPVAPIGPPSTPPVDPELLKVHQVNCTNTFDTASDKVTLYRLLTHFSSWSRLRRAVAYLLRLKQFLLTKSKNGITKNMFSFRYLSVEEFRASTLAIVKLVQIKYFHKELNSLKNNDRFFVSGAKNIHSPLRKLCPIQVNGILRVGGRLQNSSLSDSAKHPIILPSNHHVTKLIILGIHEKEGHVGPLHTLSVVRQHYWVVKGHVTVRKVIRECRFCRHMNAQPGKQLMATLPSARVTPGKPPFAFTGVDYAGPYTTTVGRRSAKRYICLFSCMTTRALHLECAYALDVDSFLLALQRFTARLHTRSHLQRQRNKFHRCQTRAPTFNQQMEPAVFAIQARATRNPLAF